MTERKGANFMPKMEFSDSLWGVHNYEKIAGVTGNDTLTVRAQAIEEGTRNQSKQGKTNKKTEQCGI